MRSAPPNRTASTASWSRVLVFLAAGCVASSALGQTADEANRLIAVAKLWATVKYFHPDLAYREIDWDGALVAALPKIRAARSAADYSAAVSSLLANLPDRSTFVERQSPPNSARKIDRQPDGTVLISGDVSRADLLTAVRSAHAITFDLHSSLSLSNTIDNPEVAEALGANAMDYPGQRTWMHSGLPSSSGISSAEFYSAFVTRPGKRRSLSAEAPNLKLTFLLGDGSRLPAAACTLFAAGRASVFSDGPHYVVGGVDSVTLPLGEGVNATVRLSEPVLKDGRSIPSFDTPQTPGPVLPSVPTSRQDKAYADDPYPTAESRILAAYKIWGAFRYFFAYRDLVDEDWDDIFATYLPQIVAAKNALEYNLKVAEFLTKVDDSNVTLRSRVMDDYFGTAAVPLRLGLIEKRPVVLAIFNEEATQAGIHVGDVITEVDGEEMASRIKREAQYISASTQQSIRQLVMSRVLDGAPDSTATLTVRDEEGHLKHVMLKRSNSYFAAMRNQRTGDVVKTLAGNIGYIDLDRLQPNRIDSAFEQLNDTKAIIFDMRGTPLVDPAILAAHLTDKSDVAAAIVTGPLNLRPDVPRPQILTDTASYFFVQAVPHTGKAPYQGKTAMLIDERTSGEAEHLALYVEAASNPTFIGAPSAGAYTIPTDFAIPGGITITFSGRDIRHGNAGKLQRVGILPNIPVDVTVNGIRNGRDEILEKALASTVK